jgi:hypothetical protein
VRKYLSSGFQRRIMKAKINEGSGLTSAMTEKELDIRQPIKAQEKKEGEEEHPEHISD